MTDEVKLPSVFPEVIPQGTPMVLMNAVICSGRTEMGRLTCRAGACSKERMNLSAACKGFYTRGWHLLLRDMCDAAIPSKCLNCRLGPRTGRKTVLVFCVTREQDTVSRPQKDIITAHLL